MISNPFFLLSILCSTFLAFFTTAFAIEVVIKIFRIKQHRSRAILRLFPFCSLITDLLFSRFSIAYWINPLSCASCVQNFFLEIFFPQLKAYLSQNQISLLNYLSIDHHHTIFSVIFSSIVGISLLLGLRKLVQAFSLVRSLQSIVKSSALYDLQIENVQLAKVLQQNMVKIYASDEICIPLTAYAKAIMIPQKTIDLLTQQEFEAVIAHELEHVIYQDSLTRLSYNIVITLFWWVPTRSWTKKIEMDQEMACDQSILKYGLKRESIASALVKVSKEAKANHALCYFTSHTNPTMARLHVILGISPPTEDRFLGLNFLGIALGAFFFAACLIWL